MGELYIPGVRMVKFSYRVQEVWHLSDVWLVMSILQGSVSLNANMNELRTKSIRDYINQ